MAQETEKNRYTPYTKLPLNNHNDRSSTNPTDRQDEVISTVRHAKQRPRSFYIALSLFVMNAQLVGYILYMYLSAESPGFVVKPCTGGEDVPHDSLIIDHGVFSELNLDEIRAVENYMLTETEIKFSKGTDFHLNSTKFALVELWLPQKADALAYFDSNGTKPAREARVVLVRGDLPIPVTEEYIVGPLPNPTWHRHQNSKDDKRPNPTPFHTRPSDISEWTVIREIAHQVALKADRILRRSYKMSALDCDGVTIACVRYDNAAPGSMGPGKRESWFRYMRDENGYYLHPTAFQVLIDFKSVNTSQWRPIKFFYEGYYADTLDEILELFDMNFFKKPIADYELNRKESLLEHNGEPIPEKPKMGPRQYYPEGKRYTVNGNSVSYMNWKFQYSFFTSLGLQLYDIKFANERIIYELGAQEVAVLYSGITPLSYTTNFFDSQYLLGAFSFEMVPGIDCPDHASFIDAIVFKVGRPVKLKNAICIFEHSNAIPLRRHYEMDSYNYVRGNGKFEKVPNEEESYHFYGGLNDDVLIIRTIAALFNYDYIFDYILHNNGALEARVTPTGYVHAAPIIHDHRQFDYGFHIFGNALATIHNHLVHFKIDMDVKGIQNRFETLDIVPDSLELDWTTPPTILHQRKFKRNLRKTEREAALKYNFEEPKKYLMYGNDTDRYGNKKSFQISMAGMSKVLLPENEGVEPGISWARYQLAVTKRKDNERSSSSLYNGVDPYEPAVHFHEYIADDESIVDQDLVAWASLGVMHIPGTADIPNTPTTNGHLTLRIAPFNYHESDPSIAVRDSVYIEPGKVDKHGGSRFEPCLPKYTPFEYDGREIEL